MFEELPKWLEGMLYALFAAFGGTMGYLMRSVDSQMKVNWARAAMEGFAAGFVGLIVLMMCQAMELSKSWTGVIVGVSGWLGATVTIRLLEGIVRNKVGAQPKPETPDANNPQQ